MPSFSIQESIFHKGPVFGLPSSLVEFDLRIVWEHDAATLDPDFPPHFLMESLELRGYEQKLTSLRIGQGPQNSEPSAVDFENSAFPRLQRCFMRASDFLGILNAVDLLELTLVSEVALRGDLFSACVNLKHLTLHTASGLVDLRDCTPHSALLGLDVEAAYFLEDGYLAGLTSLRSLQLHLTKLSEASCFSLEAEALLKIKLNICMTGDQLYINWPIE